MLEVSSGRPTAAERLGHREFAIHRRNPDDLEGFETDHMAMPNLRSEVVAAPAGRVGSFRWTICGLLFLAATINYVDRQVIGILKPTLQAEFGWSEIDYADIVFAFQLAYAIGFLFAGRVMDLLGIKRGFALALTIWSLAAMAAAEVGRFGPAAAVLLGTVGLTYSASVAGFILVRFVLGLGESGNFPRRDQDRRGMVPAARARLRHRAVQRRHQHRRGDHADDRAVHHSPLRLVLGVRPDRRAGLRLAGGVAHHLRKARSASAAESRRSARTSPPIRSCRPRTCRG